MPPPIRKKKRSNNNSSIVPKLICRVCERYNAKKNCTTCGTAIFLECVFPILLKYEHGDSHHGRRYDVEYTLVEICSICYESSKYFPKLVAVPKPEADGCIIC